MIEKLHVSKMIAMTGMAGAVLVLTGCAGGNEYLNDPGGIRPRTAPTRNRTETHASPDSVDQDLPELTEGSPIEDYFRYALEKNEAVRAAFRTWQAAAERPRQAGSLPDPRLSFQADDSFESRELSVSQTFPWYGKRALRAQAEQSGAMAEYSRYIGQKLDVLNNVRRTYGDYYYLSQAIDITEENLDLMEYFEEVIRRRFEAGQAPHADLIRIEVETEKLRDRLEELRDQRRPRAAELNRVLGRPVSASLPWPVSLPENNVHGLEEERLMESALDNNPQLLAIRHDIDRRVHQKDLAGKEYYPDITVGAMRMEDAMGGMGGGVNIDAAMVSINIPLWRGKYDAGVREADRRLEAGRRSLADAEYGVESALENAFFRFRDAQRRIELYENHLLPKSEESLEVSESAYRAGEVDVIELLDAQREWLNFELELKRSRTDRFKSVGVIEKLIGTHLSDPLELSDRYGRPDSFNNGDVEQ